MLKIAVLDYRLLPDVKEQLQALASNTITFPDERCPEQERIARTGDATIALVTPWDKIDTAYLHACPQLKYVGLCGTSTANIDLAELEKRGIGFSNIVSKDKESVAEYIFMELVSLLRGAGEYQWKPGEEHELVGRRMGIIGLGEVGKAIAHMALAYKMQVAYVSPHRRQEWEDRGVAYMEMPELIAASEIIAVCSPTNVQVLGEEEFDTMQPGTILVQGSSGTPFPEPAFAKWVARDGNFALFDMSAGEQNYQLRKNMPRVIFPRAVAGDTYESNQRRGQRALENLRTFLQSNPQ
ncbi:MAG TPA: NAD(P)-dependent oxidoreductase [Candidatus Saccharimonadales bacterium]|nr:NAD(P)-dependent oxidoreductase [Candidatus Saccharimonadales bacterium]